METFVSSLLSSVAIWQSNRNHNVETLLSRTLHVEAQKVAQELHVKEMELAVNQHLQEVKLAEKMQHFERLNERKYFLNEKVSELEQHFQELSANLISGNRESESDMHNNMSLQFQNIIVTAAVMFAALSSSTIEGLIPAESPTKAVYALAIFSGLGFSMFFICIVLGLKVVNMMTNFMYKRARDYNEILHKLIDRTKTLILHLNDLTKKLNDQFSTSKIKTKELHSILLFSFFFLM